MNIAIVDDKEYLRQSLLEKLQSVEDGFRILFEACDGTDFIDKIKAAPVKPDVVLMDIEMPEMNGIQAIQVASPLSPGVKFLVLTVFDDEEKIFTAIKSGAHGYLLKDETAQNIADAIHQVYEDEGAPMSPAVARKAWKWLTSLSQKPVDNPIPIAENDAPTDCILSKREKEILTCSMMGKEYEQIAQELFLSKHTIRQHMKNIYKKLHVSNKVEALQVSLKNQWI